MKSQSHDKGCQQRWKKQYCESFILRQELRASSPNSSFFKDVLCEKDDSACRMIDNRVWRHLCVCLKSVWYNFDGLTRAVVNDTDSCRGGFLKKRSLLVAQVYVPCKRCERRET